MEDVNWPLSHLRPFAIGSGAGAHPVPFACCWKGENPTLGVMWPISVKRPPPKVLVNILKSINIWLRS